MTKILKEIEKKNKYLEKLANINERIKKNEDKRKELMKEYCKMWKLKRELKKK
jgi:tRNA(Ile)-lysidine synthase TilS/MesJ